MLNNKHFNHRNHFYLLVYAKQILLGLISVLTQVGEETVLRRPKYLNATVLLASRSSLVESECTMAFKIIVYSLRPAQWCLTFFYFFNPKQCTHRVLRKTELKPVICIIISEYHITTTAGDVTDVAPVSPCSVQLVSELWVWVLCVFVCLF